MQLIEPLSCINPPCAEYSPNDESNGEKNVLFPQDGVVEVRIEADPELWREFVLQNRKENNYTNITVTFAWPQRAPVTVKALIRYKGASTRTAPSPSFKVKVVRC
jgi:hypothetical protein